MIFTRDLFLFRPDHRREKCRSLERPSGWILVRSRSVPTTRLVSSFDIPVDSCPVRSFELSSPISIVSSFASRSQLVNRALLNYFFDELDLLDHLNNLRAFYFLATGRFGLGFCSELSRILLSTEDARTIYHVNSMRQILYTSLDQTGQLTRFIDLLQLKTKTNLPNSLSLLDSTLLDYYDLLYDIQWPMNIVISQEMLEKYQLIFRFLLRILIVKQVLNEIWVMLKACT